MARKNRLFAKLASDVDTNGELQASGIQSEALDTGVTVYATRASLPSSGNTAGDQAYVTENNRLYIWNGSGWYNIALLNVAPSIQSVLDSDSGTTPFSLSSEGVVTTITITATDSDGDPITYAATADSDFSGLASLSQADNVFTITPFSSDSATTESGTITFTATDGVNIASSGVQTFTLNFIFPHWDETVLSIGTSSTNSLDNSTFIDRSTNASTVTTSGSPIQTAFHPYLDNWSVEFSGTDQHLRVKGDPWESSWDSEPFTIEFWFYPKVMDNGWIASFVSGSYIDWIVRLNSAGNNVRFFVYQSGGSSVYLDTNSQVNLNEWNHISCTGDGSSTLKMWLNGTYEGSAVYNGTFRSGTSGYVSLGASGGNYEYTGLISNFRWVVGSEVYTGTSNINVPTAALDYITGTLVLACASNRFIEAQQTSVMNSSGYIDPADLTDTTTPKISAFNPFGQESEYTVGENKGSGYFDGGSYLTNNTAALSLSSGVAWSISFWYYSSNTSGTQVVIAGDASGGAFESYFSNGTLKIGSALVAVYVTIPAADLPLNAWTHVAIVKNAGNVATAYVNGISKASGAWSVENPSTGFKIGSYPSQYGFTGYLSDIRWSIGQTDYTSNFTPPTAPVGNTNADLYLPFDNPGIFDQTGNNTLTLFGNTSTSTTQTKFADTAIYFGGTAQTDYIRSNKLFGEYFSAAATEIFTIEAWINLEQNNAFPTYQWHNAAIFACSPGYFVFGVDVNNKIVFYHNDGSQRNWTPGSNTISLNTWHHVAVCSDGAGGLKTFVDGIQDATGTYYGLQSASATATVELGVSGFSNSNERAFQGYIENFQILKGVAKYTANFTPPTQEQGRQYQAES